MISFSDAYIKTISVHRVGNKMLDEYFALSAAPMEPKDELLKQLLTQYFLSPFEKVNDLYRFYQVNNDLGLNTIFHAADAIFTDPSTFHEVSQDIARFLFETTDHPKIRSGELYAVSFKDIQLNGSLVSALGIFKSESKEPFIKVEATADAFDVDYVEEAINLTKLDKGCLVFELDKGDGFQVAVLDSNRTGDTVYWKDNFLKLKIRDTEFNQTNTLLTVYKDFVTNKLDDDYEITKADKIDLLNRSMNYFKDKDSFDLKEFGEEVIGHEAGIQSFKEYASAYAEERELEIPDSFSISDAAVKKQARVYKSVLKLDRNFHIYIHGNKDLIEKGYDDEKNMSYYKVFFREEN